MTASAVLVLLLSCLAAAAPATEATALELQASRLGDELSEADSVCLLGTKHLRVSRARDAAAKKNAVAQPQAAEHARKVWKTLVLSDGEKISTARVHNMTQKMHGRFDESKIQVVQGVDGTKYHTEFQEEHNEVVPMTDKLVKEWAQMRTGDGTFYHQNFTNKEWFSNGALACTLGHLKIWRMVAKAPEGQWTVILEDDSLPADWLSQDAQEKMLEAVPGDVDMVFLDDRHCQFFNLEGVIRGEGMPMGACGSSSYAITPRAARALMDVEFSYPVDVILNVAVRRSQIAALCPVGPPAYLSWYDHPSVVDHVRHHNAGDLERRIFGHKVSLAQEPAL